MNLLAHNNTLNSTFCTNTENSIISETLKTVKLQNKSSQKGTFS